MLRSDNGGRNWHQVYQYPNNIFPSVTGCMQAGLSMTLFFQSSLPSDGIMMSLDTAKTFIPICGPANDVDTRFYVRDSFIYAGDNQGGLWLNTTGIGSNSTPQLSNINFAFHSDGCHTIDTAIIITFFDSCNGVQADLKEISISGSNQFSLIGNDSIRKLHKDDSLDVRFDPTIIGSGSAKLHLRFHLGFKDFDTTISLIGTTSYKQPTPQISSATLNLKPFGCKSIDSVITLTFFDSCSGIQADLKGISLLSDGKFSIVSGENIRQLHKNDSIVVRYDPQVSGSDTAFLKLTFHLGFKDFDTTITLTGSGSSGAERVSFSMGMADSAFTGATIGVPVFVNKSISGRGLTSVSFDLKYNGDLLEYAGCSVKGAGGSASGDACATGSPIVSGKTTTLPVTITGTDISLDSLIPLIDFTFHTFLTDTNSTEIAMTNLKLNNGDPDYANCVLSADTTSTTYKNIYRCTEPILEQFLKTKTVLFITSIRPNPADNNIEVGLLSPSEEAAELDCVNALGNVCFSQKIILKQGNSSLPVLVKELPSGLYVLRIRTATQTVTQSFLKD
ncbi:MAG TPA: T9SS type A sorting domain-containing protein [Candidatus Kapabacteria bacterium]|nr:T9SS type A sorting domain-containing protein [Candidatus Kapabacteria bacterium]